MRQNGWDRGARAAVVVVAALTITSVVLWPIAVLLLPALVWAATGGRVARTTASVVVAVVTFVVVEYVGWVAVDGAQADGAARWLLAVGAALAGLAAGVSLHRWAAHRARRLDPLSRRRLRRVSAGAAAPDPSQAKPVSR